MPSRMQTFRVRPARKAGFARNRNILGIAITRSLLLAFALAIGSVLPAAAQPPVPDEGMAAIGGWIGAALPTEGGLDNSPHLAVTLDGYLTPRISVRGEVGIGWNADSRGFRNDLRRLFFNVNLVYNWERGIWHPYITGGLGLYRYTGTTSAEALLAALRDELIALGLDPSAVEDSDNKLGANLGGGVEYFLSRRSTIVADFRYHGVGNTFAIAPLDGSFFSLSVGVKRHF
jgi:hypothetical protein